MYYWDGVAADVKRRGEDLPVDPVGEKGRYAAFNTYIDASGNPHPPFTGGSNRIVSEKKSRID